VCDQADCLYAPHIAGKQALLYYFTDELHEFLDDALAWHNEHDRADITPFLKQYSERLKDRMQVGLCLVFLPYSALRDSLGSPC
jgi:hypothetical protein